MKIKMQASLVFVIIHISSCDRAIEKHTVSQPEQISTIEKFEKLKKLTRYNNVLKQVGAPVRVKGSGIAILIYTLNESSDIWIGVTSQTPDGVLVYMNLVDSKTNEVVKKIIK